jgi:hypothetical protein
MGKRATAAINLPPAATTAPLVCRVFKRYKYVTLHFVSPKRDDPGATFTLHQVEAKKLATLVLEACAAAPVTSDDILDFAFAEGAYRGGPPMLSQVVEFGAPLATAPAPTASLPLMNWEVWRQDDNGNRFLVSSGHTRDHAEEVAAEFEARGHKQWYWVAPSGGGGG